jgi:hypothetical protein
MIRRLKLWFQAHFVTDEQFHKVQRLLLLHSSNERHLQNKIGTGEDKHGRYLVFDVTPNKSKQLDNNGTQSTTEKEISSRY